VLAGNWLIGNYYGIRISGPNANGNQINGNQVGPNGPLTVSNPYNTDGQGNFFGIYVDNTANNDIQQNHISRNVSAGITITGGNAAFNWVHHNTIETNGAYGERSADGLTVTLVGYVGGAEVFGSGIYLEVGANNNWIGSKPTSVTVGRKTVSTENRQDGNLISDNTQIGIYLYNGPFNNPIRSNTITGVNHPKGPTKIPNQRTWSEYGILLFNSMGNLNNYQKQGPFANIFKGVFHYATFYPFSGNLNTPPEHLPPNANPSLAGAATKASARSRVR
jgi:parallel beta-helix repeat protein